MAKLGTDPINELLETLKTFGFFIQKFISNFRHQVEDFWYFYTKQIFFPIWYCGWELWFVTQNDWRNTITNKQIHHRRRRYHPPLLQLLFIPSSSSSIPPSTLLTLCLCPHILHPFTESASESPAREASILTYVFWFNWVSLSLTTV